MANMSMTHIHRTEGLFWLVLLLLLANWRDIYKHLLIWIHKPKGGGGRNLAGLVAMVTSISHVYSPASSQGSEQNPKPTCSFKLCICSFYISNTIERMYNIDN